MTHHSMIGQFGADPLIGWRNEFIRHQVIGNASLTKNKVQKYSPRWDVHVESVQNGSKQILGRESLLTDTMQLIMAMLSTILEGKIP